MVRSGIGYPIWTSSISIYSWTSVVSVRSFVVISNGFIMSSVWGFENHTILIVWNSVMRIPNARCVVTVETIHIPNTLRVVETIIINSHIANPSHSTSVIIVYMYSSSLDDTPIIIIINRGVFNLNYRSIVVILNVSTVIITCIEADI